jgi:L-iditol 2-dehydrogenase
MKSAFLYKKEDLKIHEVDIPQINSNEVLLKVLSCGICGSDKRMFFNGPSYRYKVPIVLGHEICGKVVKTGSNVTSFKNENIVVVAPIIPCMKCKSCLSGLDNLCEENLLIGATIHGGFSEYMLIPEQMISTGGLAKIESNVSTNVASFIELIACCLNIIDGIKFKETDNVLIVGDGPTGFIFSQLIEFYKVQNISIVLKHKEKESIADKFDFKEVKYSLKDFDKKFNHVILSNSDKTIINESIDLLKVGGNLFLFSGYHDGLTTEIDLNKIHYKQLKVHGGVDSTIKNFHKAASIISELNLNSLISKTYLLSDIEEAFYETRNKKNIKIIINP